MASKSLLELFQRPEQQRTSKHMTEAEHKKDAESPARNGVCERNLL